MDDYVAGGNLSAILLGNRLVCLLTQKMEEAFVPRSPKVDFSSKMRCTDCNQVGDSVREY